MTKYLVNFIDTNGDVQCGIIEAKDLDDANRVAVEQIANRGNVVNVMLWTDAVMKTIYPEDWL